MPNFELLSFPGPDELARAVAAAWLAEIAAASRAGRVHCVALSGGRIAQKLFAATAAQAVTQRVSFASVQFFWADERCVPPADPDSNFKMANELLFLPLRIAAGQIHRVRGEDSPSAAVKSAESELCRIASPNEKQQPALDLVFLGMGEDGHVASLFPNAAANPLGLAGPYQVVNHSPKPPATRISLSFQALFAAKNLWVLVSGAGKAAALRASLSPEGDTPLARVIQARPVKIFSDLNEF